MTIQETHIYVLQELQKINSFAVENFLSEEIDLHLNFFTRKLVDNVIGSLKPNVPSNFEHNQRLIDQIRTLVVKNHYGRAYVDSVEPDLVFSHLPSDYKHLVSDDSELSYNLYDAVTKDKVVTQVYAYPILNVNDELPLKEFEVLVDGGVKFKLSSVVGYKDGVLNVESKYQLVDILTRDIGTQFEYVYDTFLGRGKLYLVYDEPHTIITRSIVDPETNTIITTNINASILPRQTYADGVETYIRKANRLHSNANISFIKMNPYERPIWESPISTIAGGRLYVYEDKNYKVKRTAIDYVRKPTVVSYHSSVHSDLPQDAQDLVIENVIVHIKGIINDPSWQTSVQENQLNNN